MELMKITDFDMLCALGYSEPKIHIPRRAMNLSLTPELEQLVSDKVKTGMYQTASEVVREGLRLLRERDQRLESLRRDVRAGFEAVERGEFTEYDESNLQELGDRVKARGRNRLAGEERKTGSK